MRKLLIQNNKGFAALIGIIFSLVIVSILLALSLNSVSSRQKIDGSMSKTIINTTEEKLRNISKQHLMLQEQLEGITNNSGG